MRSGLAAVASRAMALTGRALTRRCRGALEARALRGTRGALGKCRGRRSAGNRAGPWKALATCDAQRPRAFSSCLGTDSGFRGNNSPKPSNFHYLPCNQEIFVGNFSKIWLSRQPLKAGVPIPFLTLATARMAARSLTIYAQNQPMTWRDRHGTTGTLRTATSRRKLGAL